MRIPAGELIPDVGAAGAGGGLLIVFLLCLFGIDSCEERWSEVRRERYAETLASEFYAALPLNQIRSEASLDNQIHDAVADEWRSDGGGVAVFNEGGTLHVIDETGKPEYFEWRIRIGRLYLRERDGDVTRWDVETIGAGKIRLVTQGDPRRQTRNWEAVLTRSTFR